MESNMIKMIKFWKEKRTENAFVRSQDLPLRTGEVIDLIGVRRSGKSSLFKVFIEKNKLKDGEYLLINFEDPFFLEHKNPQIIEKIIEIYLNYFSKDLKYVFFDEIQAIPNWELAIQKIQSLEIYNIFITGSSSKMMSKEISTVLTGRHYSIFLFPLNFEEFLTFNLEKKPDIVEQISNENHYLKRFEEFLYIGGFPQVVKTKDATLLKQYFYDILYKDIMFRYDIREKETLERIALFLLSNNAKLYSVKNIQNTFKISYELAVKYISYLKESLMFFDLQKFSYSVKAQNRSQKKIYSVDTGLSHNVSFKFTDDIGRLLENRVFLSLKNLGKKVYYHKNKHECDFIIFENQKITQAIQVTKELNPDNEKRELAGLIEACETHNLKKGIILTFRQEKEFTHKNIEIKCIPTWKYFFNLD